MKIIESEEKKKDIKIKPKIEKGKFYCIIKKDNGSITSTPVVISSNILPGSAIFELYDSLVVQMEL